jgi:hypothetical protein
VVGRSFVATAPPRRRLTSLFPPIWGLVRGHERSPDHETGDDAGRDDDALELREDLDGWLEQRDDRR